MMLSRDQRELIEFLSAKCVKYLLVGGVALAYHGSPRFTGDLDVLYERTPENVERLMAALADFGVPLRDISSSDFLQPNVIIQFGSPPGRIDLLSGIDGVEFSAAWANRVTIGGDSDLKVLVISRDDLIRNKRATGRLKDLADVEALGG